MKNYYNNYDNSYYKLPSFKIIICNKNYLFALKGNKISYELNPQ